MSSPNPSAQNNSGLPASLHQQLPACLPKLDAIDAEGIARASGFLQRSPRKIPMLKFAKGLLALAPETDLALEHTAAVIGLAADTTYTKQSLSERLSGGLKGFLAGVVTALFSQIARGVPTCQALERFAHVWVHDSTSQTLPKHLAELFPGAGNQHGQDYATLKIQWICDIKNGVVGHVSLSGYTRNDQAAAPDILEVARPGNLVLRDLGYFTTAVLAQFVSAGISFLSRYRHGVNPYDPKTGQPLNLKALLKNSGSLDMDVLLGPERAAVRLVALPVPEEVANQRRHKAKVSAQKRHRSPPGAEHLFLMGWNIFVTNVPAATWPPKVLAAIYRLRWRIEIILKPGKATWDCLTSTAAPRSCLSLSVLTKLLFCALVCQLSDLLELNCPHGQHVSLLRLGHILGQCACWFSAMVLGVSVVQWVEFCLARHAFYEKRNDRKNYYELLSGAANALA